MYRVNNMYLITLFLLLMHIWTLSITSAPCEDIYGEVDLTDEIDNDLMYRFEGDTILNQKQVDVLVYSNGFVESRFGKKGPREYANKWPKKTIIYAFAKRHFNLKQKNLIIKSMRALQNKTCIKFRPKIASDKNYVLIRNGEFCLSRVGYIGQGSQTLMLSTDGCLRHGTIVHELLHTLGFVHMHNHPKRNDFIKVMWGNIERGQKPNFRINRNMNSFGVPYDFRSIMHYGAKEFSRNNKPTLVSKFKNISITDNQSLSKGDVIKVKRMYHCP